jgi:4-alpha-glucanotransferase
MSLAIVTPSTPPCQSRRDVYNPCITAGSIEHIVQSPFGGVFWINFGVREMEWARVSGILLHPTCFPGRYGIGDLGEQAYRFVDWLAAAKQMLWQILAIGPTGYADSPYSSFSAFAGNPMIISPDRLAQDGDLSPEDLADVPHFPDDHVDFGGVIEYKTGLFHKAAQRFFDQGSLDRHNQFEGFCHDNRRWLDDFALFMAVKAEHDMVTWTQWDEDIALRHPSALAQWQNRLADEIRFHKYLQFQFFHQWQALRRYSHERGVKIMGDIPIFVAHDSADVWSHPELYYLDERGGPTVVAGVPPDYFSATGQRWGNPLYRWELMQEKGYSWWVDRVRKTFSLVDILRIDHFRGFEAYWEIPASEPTAVVGRWVKGPGDELFQALQGALGQLPIVAEDLGVVTPEVVALREEFGFPGMKVLQFAFDSDASNPYLPFNLDHDCVVYTGTHDNDTTRGWYENQTEELRHRVRLYLGSDAHEISWDFIRLALATVADLAVVPLQDVLGLGSEGRMNRPGDPVGNWQWRYLPGALADEQAGRLRSLVEIYGREGLKRDKVGNVGDWLNHTVMP